MTTSCSDCGQVHDGVCAGGNKSNPVDAWLASVATPVRPPPLKAGKPDLRPSRRWHALWLICLALAVSLPIAYWREGTQASYTIGYAIGTAFVPLLIAFVILRFSVAGAWISLLVIFGLSILGYAMGDLKRNAGASLADQEASALHEELKRAAAGALTQYRAEPVESRLDARIAATTELEAIKAVRRIFNEAHGEQARLAQTLAAEEAKLDFASVLAPENLVSAQGIAQGRATLVAYEQIHWRRVEGARIYSQYMDTYMTAEVPRSQFADMWERYEAGKRVRDPLIQNIFDNQLSIMRSATAILDFMEPLVGVAQLGGGQVMFDSQSDVDTYNALLADLNRHAQQESVLTQRLERSNEQILRRLDD